MNLKEIQNILKSIEKGEMSSDAALDRLRHLPFTNIDISKHDAHRSLRNGFSEVVFCEGKNIEHLVKIIGTLVEKKINIFGTRASAEVGERIKKEFSVADYDPVSKTLKITLRELECHKGNLAIMCAGTADLFVAEEAKRTAEYFGYETRQFYDVGVAGLHRLISYIEDLSKVDCAIVVAGMEGALPSVVGGLISCPIIACPTSVGYGANLKGFTALLAMLNSCSEGISVVNIDNGFGAACAAIRIMRRFEEVSNMKQKT